MLQKPQLTHRKSLDLMSHASRRELWMPNPTARQIVGKLVAAATVAVTYLSLGVYLNVTHIMRMEDGRLGQMTICIHLGSFSSALSVAYRDEGKRRTAYYTPHTHSGAS